MIPEFLDMVDSEGIAFLAGVELSYFDEQSQKAILSFSEDKQMKIKLDFVKALRKFSSEVNEDVLSRFCGITKERDTVPTENENESIKPNLIYEDEISTEESHEESPKQTKPTTKSKINEEEHFEEKSTEDFSDSAVSELETLDQDEIQKSLNLTMDMWSKSPEEINKMCDSGMFNSIIEGYILLAFDEMGITNDIRLSHIFDTYSAEDARERAGNT